MKTRIFQIAVIMAFLLCVGKAYAGVKAPADMMLNPPDGMKITKPSVFFSHTLHGKANIDCSACHHTWDGQSAVLKCSNAGCHDQPGKKDVMTFYKAFHASKSDISCVGCHKKNKKAGHTTGPTSCKKCHVKK